MRDRVYRRPMRMVGPPLVTRQTIWVFVRESDSEVTVHCQDLDVAAAGVSEKEAIGALEGKVWALWCKLVCRTPEGLSHGDLRRRERLMECVKPGSRNSGRRSPPEKVGVNRTGGGT